MEEHQTQVLKAKSQLQDKDAQIEQLFETLTNKGEEAGELSKKLIMLKQHLLDQSLFEEQYLVVRVPLSESSAQTQSPLTQGQKGSQRKVTVQTNMVLSFIRDTQLPGEYFLKIETMPDNQGQPNERKLVPALDIKQILSQSLEFTIILQDDCNDNDYDIPDEKVVSRRQSLLAYGSALNPMKLLRKDSTALKSQQSFPMTFESEYAPKIIDGFRLLQTLAHERQLQL